MYHILCWDRVCGTKDEEISMADCCVCLTHSTSPQTKELGLSCNLPR
jgi:hypothetical protein